jgi:hypothetical protein
MKHTEGEVEDCQGKYLQHQDSLKARSVFKCTLICNDEMKVAVEGMCMAT